MKILIDIGHPAHVHYFKNLMWILKKDGYEFIITARKKSVIEYLLNVYNFEFKSRGKGRDSVIGKLLYMLRADIQLLLLALKKKPDLFLSFSSPYAAQVAWMMRKPHIAMNDTEHSDANHKIFTYPFSSVILTPESYKNDLGAKHKRFNSIVEALYLHDKYFTPDPSIYEYLKIPENTAYVIVRFISWKAHHDYGQSGLNIETKRELIRILSKKYKIFISSEAPLPNEFAPYEIDIPPEKMHDVLNFASIFIGESGTMASESAFLGTPSVYINSLPLMCYLDLEEKAGLLKHFRDSEWVVEFVKSLMDKKDLKVRTLEKKNKMVHEFIDPTLFLVRFIERYINNHES